MIIQSSRGEYEVNFLTTLQAVINEIGKIKNGFMVMDRAVIARFKVLSHDTFVVDAVEDNKTFPYMERILFWLQDRRANRDSTLIAIGGGITQDVASMAANQYHRGINLILVPTTLLAQADSCIGSKCGVNFGGAKNQIGCFHAPSRVMICTEFLDTLEDRDIESGYGEIFKLSLIGGWFGKLKDALESKPLYARHIDEFIFSSLGTKKIYIEQDEYDLGIRKILNFGHTFGHALESTTNYAVPHGLAVAWGIDLVNFIAWKKGIQNEKTFREVHDWIGKTFSFRIDHCIPAKQLLREIQKDKKMSSGKINLVLMRSPGDMKMVETEVDDKLESMVSEYLERFDVFHEAR